MLKYIRDIILRVDDTLAFTFDDVLLKPRRSSLKSRRDIETTTYFTRNIKINIPFVSAPMDTVTEHSMAITLARLGGIGVIHRFTSIEHEVNEVIKVKRAENIVIEKPYKINLSSTVGDVRKVMEDKDVSGLLVVDDYNRLKGIVTARDILFQPGDKKVTEVMTPRNKMIVAKGEISIDDAKELLWKNRVEKLPIVDDDDRVIGLITASDIVKKMRYPNAARDSKGRLLVAAAIGVRGDYIERAEKLYEAEADALVVDVAHGHMDRVIEVVKDLRKKFKDDIDIVAGNVATYEGAKDLMDAGVDSVRVGIGPGSVCTTRIVAGVGVPQLTAIIDSYKASKDYGIPIIADGGIRNPGDVVKALAAGASTVMIGRLFAGTDESPGSIVLRNGKRFKIYRGMASFYARLGREARERGDLETVEEVEDYSYTAEGIEAYVEYKGSVEDVIKRLISGLRAGMSYLGAKNINELRENAVFIRVSSNSLKESYPHDVFIW